MKHVALLRGINVGGNHTVDMKQLKTAFESFGYENVSTYINSGNVFFESATDAKKHIAKINHALKKEFGFEIPIVIQDQKTILNIAKSVPVSWENDTNQKSDILFLFPDYDRKSSLSLIKVKEGIDTLIYIKGAIAWNVPREHYHKSGISKFIGSELYKNSTARNVNTLRKIAEKMK